MKMERREQRDAEERSRRLEERRRAEQAWEEAKRPVMDELAAMLRKLDRGEVGQTGFANAARTATAERSRK